MPFDKSRYPDDWDEIARQKKEAAGWQCEECGMPHMGDNTMGSCLTIHHPNRDTWDRDAETRALCARCHLRDEPRARREEKEREMDLLDIARELRQSMRLGADKDEPEGNRYILLSDTLANHIADTLEKHCRQTIIEDKKMQALERQVGGDHYKEFEIQPVEFISRNNLDFLQGCIVKRICRYRHPGGKGLEDLKKIKHEVGLIIESERWPAGDWESEELDSRSVGAIRGEMPDGSKLR